MSRHQKGELKARPSNQPSGDSAGAKAHFPTGFRRTGLETKRDGALYVPSSVDGSSLVPLVVSLHGAGGDAHHGIGPFQDLCDRSGSILLAPESQGSTWDVIVHGYGADVYWIDEALSDVFSLYPIDPNKIAIIGFSDGASYALSLGLTNGDLFTHLMAFAPGFFTPTRLQGQPRIFVAHGTQDRILPIDRCSRKLVPRLRDGGFQVNYEEFEGGHTIPPEIAKKSFNWFLGSSQNTQGAHVPSTQSGIEFT